MIEIKDVTKSYGRQKSYKMFPLKLWKENYLDYLDLMEPGKVH